MERFKTVNLEQGMPTVAQATRLLAQALTSAKREGLLALKLIHGYGSSGTGGRLRVGLREELEKKRRAKVIADFIPGEEWSIFNKKATDALARCRDLSKDRDLNRSNNGITIVVL